MVRCTWDRAEVQAAEQTAHPSAVRAGGRVLSSNGCTQIDEEPFIDARHIYRKVDRAHRDWTDAQVGFLAGIVKLYRGEEFDSALATDESRQKLDEIFGKKPTYKDVAGLCKSVSIEEIRRQGWSLNPGRFVGVTPGEELNSDDFLDRIA
ncbi:MAG TPA: N-6 DNA methylase, partial [Opitutaceae bacterium]